MRRTSGWGGGGGLLRLPDGTTATAPVPCHCTGSAGAGRRCSYWSSEGRATIRPRLRNGVLERELTSVTNLIPNQDSQRAKSATAATKIMEKHGTKRKIVCFEEKRLSTSALASEGLVAPPGLHGFLFKGGQGWGGDRPKVGKDDEKIFALCATKFGVRRGGGGGGLAGLFQCLGRETCLGSGDASGSENGACRIATTSICLSRQLVIKSKKKFKPGPPSSLFGAPCGSLIGPEGGPDVGDTCGGENSPKKFRAPRNHTKNFLPMLGHATWHPNIPHREKWGVNTISALHGATINCASLQATCVCCIFILRVFMSTFSMSMF